ncbi:hypothetical protein [Nonomuraea sp. NPDC048826]|uniref:hypothetical protein n=1 Tax=Nonomuraea sp. NPDC048826 TaxID=3364347 RepID=UPI00371A77C1
MAETGMQRVTVVAWYGEKSALLDNYIRTVQELMQQLLGPVFQPRVQEEVHATIIGLEHSTDSASLGSLLRMIRMLRSEFIGGVPVQFGGYNKSLNAFTSRGLRLYDRTLWLQGNQCVTIGWPIINDHPTTLLDTLRRECGRYGFPHKYHRTPDATDPDAYMVVGGLNDADAIESREAARRLGRARELVSQEGVKIVLRAADIFLVHYEDTSLPLSTSRANSIIDFEDEATLGHFLREGS